jgi:formiminotetrahydrofolate cyclodeaminase
MKGNAMDFLSMSCDEFTEALASKEPVPGGGGASALVGALGIALGNMVGNLTVGKKKYAAVEARIYELMAEADLIQKELLSLVRRDAEVFQPLAEAYRLPHSTPEEQEKKDLVMEKALKRACDVPVQIMETVCRAIDLIAEFSSIGSRMAVSDAGAAAAFSAGALRGASLNVFINTRSMKDRKLAEELNRKAEEMLDQYLPKADEVFLQVRKSLQAAV